ncbi:hypothetical protein P3T76_008620 [Phytophthora citrophthora]|uniref:Uncharacterized protein n=1 Tax=Phytophthora citrophthora TaxID=4793 RepID=A0AAD9GIQ5_9STRA|nr:hypothetical protein P3T76_008620 [Phytophthora citrophthora]
MQEESSHRSDAEYVIVDEWDSSSPTKKRKRTLSIENERNSQVDTVVDALNEARQYSQTNAAADTSTDETQNAKEEKEGDAEAVKGNGHLENERETQKDVEPVSNGSINNIVKEKMEESIAAPATEETAPSPVTSSIGYISGVEMVFPENEVPIELCPFSSDGSVEATQPESPPRRTKSTAPQAFQPPTSTIVIHATPSAAVPEVPAPATPEISIPTTPASVTAEDSTVPDSVVRTNGRRKRKKKLSYSAPRSKAATKAKQVLISEAASPVLEDKLRIAVNGHATENSVELDPNNDPPPSPVYPDADASHLYPSTSEGEPWRWEDVESYFGPIGHHDLENLIRWRKENADCIAANPNARKRTLGMDSKRAILDAMLADASGASAAPADTPIRRGRNYRDVWEERDFLEHHKRDCSVGETPVKSQVLKTKKKRKGVIDAEGSLLQSHRNLVYGYDDDLFHEFRDRLEDRAKLYETKLIPSTPPTPERQQQESSGTVDECMSAEVVFDEEVLPSFPIRQLHPASLGLWKLRKNEEPDYSVVHPASISRTQIPARWKEEMVRHHQQRYQLQLQQTDELTDPSDGDDEGTGESSRDRLRATIFNSEVTGGLPSFGDCVEEDEISQALESSLRKLIPLSMYNWRTAQLVYERARCSIQCAPILEGEAAAARELEDVFLQLCPPEEPSVDLPVLPGTAPARQPRSSQLLSTPHDMIAYSVRHDIAGNFSLAVAASVEFALGLSVGDVVDVLDRNGCWNYGEVVETYSEDKLGITKFLLMRFSLWSEDTVEWIAASEGRILPRGVADGTRPCSVGPTRAHRVRIRYDQNLARDLERSFPHRHANQSTAASRMLAQQRQNIVIRSSTSQQKTPQKRKRKRPGKSAARTTTT